MDREQEISNQATKRTRRNIMKMGAIAVPSTLATVQSASAGQGPICTILGIFGLQCPPTSGGNGGGGGGNCFLRGTKILTVDGERNIEDLAIGDLLPTMFGGRRPVQWIGHYRRKKSDPSKPWVASALPVRIARSALAPDVPHADLYVTAAHSLLIDGVLAPAELLINGTTITRYDASETDELEYFHIKLESHDVIYAEGAPAETLCGSVDESAVNFAGYLRRYGTRTQEEPPCAPLIPVHGDGEESKSYGRREELKSRFRSALSPWIDFRNQADILRDKLEEAPSV